MTKDYSMGRKDMRLSGFLMPGAEVLDERCFIKKILLDGFRKDIQIIVPKDLLTEQKNENMLHVEILAENNFHSYEHALVYEIIAKEINEISEQKNVNFCKIKGEISSLHVYHNKVDVLVHAKPKGDYSKNAYIPISFIKKCGVSFHLGQYVRIYGHLIERSFQKNGDSKVVLEVIGDYVY